MSKTSTQNEMRFPSLVEKLKWTSLVNSALPKLSVGAPNCVRRQLSPRRQRIGVEVLDVVDLVVIVEQLGFDFFVFNCIKDLACNAAQT